MDYTLGVQVLKGLQEVEYDLRGVPLAKGGAKRRQGERSDDKGVSS